MVNYGVSRGCQTCKHRRKKVRSANGVEIVRFRATDGHYSAMSLDRSDPLEPGPVVIRSSSRLTVFQSCRRCLKSKRACPGYDESESTFVFRHYVAMNNVGVLDASSGKPDLLTGQAREDATFETLDHARLERDALDMFFQNYCVESRDKSISRGFLDGIKSLITRAGQSSDIAKAARIVALSGLGNRLGESSLVQNTRRIYGDLLLSFQNTLSDPQMANTIESLMTAVLLGIYEVNMLSQSAHR